MAILDDSFELCDEALSMTEYSQYLLDELASSDPNSIGMQIRVDVMESDYALRRALRLVVEEQLWENQINMHGRKLPEYKPDTIRKKKALGHPADKLVNYTEYWTGRFANEGVYIWADASEDRWELSNTLKYPYFKYIDSEDYPRDILGFTDENYYGFLAEMDMEVEQEQYEYYVEKMEERGYDIFF